MKILKNFTLISLLLATCIPTETRPFPAPSLPVLVFGVTQWIVGGAIYFTALGYIPYLFLTRHEAAQNFVKHQDDISSYSIALEARNNGNISLITCFTGTDYKKVITDALTYLQTEELLLQKLARTEKLYLTPCITLADEKTTRPLRRFLIADCKKMRTSHKVPVTPSSDQKLVLDYKRIENNLMYQFKIPRIKTYASPIRYVVTGFTCLAYTAWLGLLGASSYFTLIPAAIIGIPFLFKNYSSAQSFVDRQEDIASYSVTVKIKRHVKTIKEQTFSGPDYQTVMNDALLYAHAKQTAGLRTVFKPSITLVDDEQIYPLRNIVKKTLPKKPTHLARYWRRLASSLSDRFIIPNDDSANITNVNRIAYFGLESGVWMLSPYVAVLPFLL